MGASGTNNMILTILQGISRKDGAVDVFMPAFARKLTDKEISALGTYLARQFGNPSVSIAEKDVKRLR